MVFTGERLPDGRLADCVYIVLNQPYWEVVNHAPVRPLDYDYLKALTPGAQRFYARHGYVPAGTLPDFARPGITENIFWKRLR